MDFLKNNLLFDFLYDGKPFSQYDFTKNQIEKDNTVTTVYCFDDGLKITNIATKYAEAYEWVNYLENTSDKPTKVISELFDANVTLPMSHQELTPKSIYQPEFNELTAVYNPKGSTWTHTDFCTDADVKAYNRFLGHIQTGQVNEYSTSGGRSSEKNAPFFNIHKDGKGYIFAIGWTGQWNCFLERRSDDVVVKTKIEDTNFRLLPGEKIRTSSFVLMPYEASVVQSQNLWRRVVKKHFSLIGKDARAVSGPLCAGIWGGLESAEIVKRIEIIKNNNLPFEYIWMDAGWCGGNTKPSPDEFEGDWAEHTGDWRVSPLIHPNGLKDVASKTHEAGMKFLLWFEPERVKVGTPITLEHPEFFIFPENEKNTNLLLNLGDENAWNYCFNTLAGIIEQIGVDCYRQDFNMAPLYSYWRKNDSENRKGITEIKHINGLYRLWDSLLEKFPELIIDNCASGGRRIDIETLRRSIPLWRSDYQCPANVPTEGTQCHNLSFNSWMPYSGTGAGRSYFDTYRVRSSYGSSLTTNYTYSARQSFGDDPEKLNWLKNILHEYLRVRPFMSEDFYPLTDVSDRSDVWCAAQFIKYGGDEGMLQIFRREKSPYETANFNLYNIDKNADYIFIDADDESETVFSGAYLLENGFKITIKEKYTSKIYFYKKASKA